VVLGSCLGMLVLDRTEWIRYVQVRRLMSPGTRCGDEEQAGASVYVSGP
jgi:hypothetical protein